MSTWIVQVVVVALFALTCGALALAWMRGRLGGAAIVLFAIALVVWVAAFVAIAAEFRGRERLRDVRARAARRSTTSPRSRSSQPPLLIALAALAMLVARGSRWRLRRRRRRESRLVASSFKLPDLGEGLTEGEVARWLVAEGQEIAEDDPLVEIQTDKATVEIPSPYAGTVLRILVAEGEIAPVGTQLVVIGEPGEEAPSNNLLQAPSHRPPERAQVTICYKARAAVPRRGACRRRRSFAGSRRSSASTSPSSPGQARVGGSPRTTCARRGRCEPRGGASRCEVSAA